MSLRDLNLKQQIRVSFIYKIAAILISFLVVRFMLEYLGTERYGIWSVILTFINFILFFDLGIVNGIKNKVSVSLSKDEHFEAKEYVSTGYGTLILGVSVVYLLFLTISSSIDWQAVFNTTLLDDSTLNMIVLVSLFFILVNFILSIIIALYNATQNASLIVLNQLLSQSISLLLIYALIDYTSASILYIAFAYGIALVLSNIVMSIYFYKKHRSLIPSMNAFKRSKVKGIFTLGLKFFVLQLTFFIILSTDKMLIAHLLGATHVTSYDILFKYFSVITIIHGIINTPLWSMYTEAYEKNDFDWIEKRLFKMAKLMIAYIGLALIMYFLAPNIIRLWLGDVDLGLSTSNYLYMIFFFLILSWYSIFAYFSNGIGKTKTQLITAILGAVLNIPLSIYFTRHLGMGLDGILIATIISLLFFSIAGPIQAYREIRSMKSRALLQKDQDTR